MSATLLSVGQIAARLREPLHRVEYVIKSRAIQSRGRVGNARAFTETDVERIAAELRRMDADKGVGNG